MKKLLKWVGYIVAIGILLAILLLVCLFTFVNPNRFKPLITERIKQSMGLQLTMEGDLAWSLFPTLGVKAERVSLSNPAGFKQATLAEINQMIVSVRLMPLLHKKIESEGIVLDGLKLNLIKNKKGLANWVLPIGKSDVHPENSVPSSVSKKAIISFVIKAIEVKHGEITYLDESKNQKIKISDLLLQAKDINSINPFPFSTEFDYASNQPNESGHVKLTSQVAMDFNRQVYSFRDTRWILETKQKNKLSLAGDIIADISQDRVKWSNLTGKLNDFSFKGHVGISSLKESLHVSGELQLDALQVNHIKLTHVVLPFTYQDNLLSVSPVSGDFYKGRLQATTSLNVKSTVPQLNVSGTVSHFQIGALLADLATAKQKISLTGTGHANFNLKLSGSALSGLNGQAELTISDGIIKGVDLAYLINSARALVNANASDVSNSNQTPFSRLFATAVFRNGLMSNTDLSLQTAITQSQGHGTIDLVRQHINYELATTINQSTSQKDDKSNLYGIAIPIMIVGPLSDPKIAINPQAILKAFAEMQLKKTQSDMSEQIKKRIKRRATGGLLLHNLLGN